MAVASPAGAIRRPGGRGPGAGPDAPGAARVGRGGTRLPERRDPVRRHHEGALHLDDLLTRRTRISIETSHRGADSAWAVARVVAPILGWNEETVEDEVRTYLARVESERASQEQHEDAAADAARILAPRAGAPATPPCTN